MKRRFRLTGSADFKRVRRNGKSYAHPLIVLIALPNNTPGSRLGVAAGRSVGNAVRRNRAKRLLRAALQNRLSYLQPGWDIILIARSPMTEAKLLDVQTALDNLLSRSRLLRNNHDN